MKRIVAINCSPRAAWNTAALVREAAKGAENEGAEVKVIDLYKLDKFTGCISCFGCKLPENLGKCIYKDALAPVLEEIRNADGLILGTPNYLGDVSSGFRSLYERLIFQYITYKTEPRSYSDRSIPVLFIMTSNAPEAFYTPEAYGRMVENYQNSLVKYLQVWQAFEERNKLICPQSAHNCAQRRKHGGICLVFLVYSLY